MKIAFVIGLYPHHIGGAEMQAREIAMALEKQGHSIYYVCYSSKIYSSDEFCVSIISARSKWDFFHYGTRKLLWNTLDTIQPDVVYHRAFVPYSRFVAQWSKKNNVPFFFHCADIYTLTRKNSSLYNIIQNKWLDYTLKNANGVICQNREQYDVLSKYKLNKLQIIYNIHRINEAPINLNKKKNVIWIAKFEPSKQPELFIDLAERYDGEDVTFTMFSSKRPNTEINKKLLDRIRRIPRLNLVEGKDNDYINNYLCNSASLLVNTSVSEGISNTFIQAWMRGVPVISLNSNPDGWFDKYQIGACCKGDVLEISKLISKILDAGAYALYSKNAKAFAEDKFSSDVVTPQIVKFMQLKTK